MPHAQLDAVAIIHESMSDNGCSVCKNKPDPFTVRHYHTLVVLDSVGGIKSMTHLCRSCRCASDTVALAVRLAILGPSPSQSR